MSIVWRRAARRLSCSTIEPLHPDRLVIAQKVRRGFFGQSSVRCCMLGLKRLGFAPFAQSLPRVLPDRLEQVIATCDALHIGYDDRFVDELFNTSNTSVLRSVPALQTDSAASRVQPP